MSVKVIYEKNKFKFVKNEKYSLNYAYIFIDNPNENLFLNETFQQKETSRLKTDFHSGKK